MNRVGLRVAAQFEPSVILSLCLARALALANRGEESRSKIKTRTEDFKLSHYLLACELGLSTETEVVVDEYRGTSENVSREDLVVALNQAKRPSVIGILFFALDLHQTEVSCAIMSEAVGFAPDGEGGRCQCALNGLNELAVWDRLPGFGCPWSFDLGHFLQFHSMSAAVKDRVGMPALGSSRRLFEYLDHTGFLFLGGASVA